MDGQNERVTNVVVGGRDDNTITTRLRQRFQAAMKKRARVIDELRCGRTHPFQLWM